MLLYNWYYFNTNINREDGLIFIIIIITIKFNQIYEYFSVTSLLVE